MIHYHGTPLTPQSVAASVLARRHAFVSFADPRDLGLAMEVCRSFALDNGAFSAWNSGEPITDWTPYYRWADEAIRHPGCDFAVIPDVIDGDEAANNRLVREWPLGVRGAPVWHLHETTARLQWLVREWPRVCLGSSGEFSQPGTPAWWDRIAQAMKILCDSEGRPLVKIHGLRMLDPDLFTRIPFSSADSTNVCRNVCSVDRFSGGYQPVTAEARGVVLADRIEAFNSPARWAGRPVQTDIFGRVA